MCCADTIARYDHREDTPMSDIDQPPHAQCRTCGIDLATREAADAHRDETMEAARARGEIVRSHTTVVINPEPLDLDRLRASSVLTDALHEAAAYIDRRIQSGEITEAAALFAMEDEPSVLEQWKDYFDG